MAGLWDRSAPREAWETGVGQPLWWLRLLGLSALAGGVLGLIGFLNDELLICLFDWLGMIIVGGGLAGLMVPPAMRALRSRGAPLGVAAAVAIAGSAAPISLFAAAFGLWAWSPVARTLSPADWYFKTLFVEVFLAGLWFASEFALERAAPGGVRFRDMRPVLAGPARAAGSGLGSELAPDPVICLQMEDHYVRIHRRGGARLELLTLSDAIRRYGTDGLQVHRSWWVATSAIEAVERSGRNLRLRLVGGLSAPVARRNVTRLRELGLELEPVDGGR